MELFLGVFEFGTSILITEIFYPMKGGQNEKLEGKWKRPLFLMTLILKF